MQMSDTLFPEDDTLENTLSGNAAEEAIILDSSQVVTPTETHASGGLTQEEQERLKLALIASWAIPFIGDVRDFTWEAIFHYVKKLPIPDPMTEGTSKKLFDVVDKNSNTGWSQKALIVSNRRMSETAENTAFEFIIQRSDIFKQKNYETLGLGRLDKDTLPEIIGAGLVKYWKRKVEKDRGTQTVRNQRIGFLLKTKDRKRYLYFEQPLSEFDELLDDQLYEWVWTDETKTGLQARKKDDKRVLLRWYPNQKQLFQCLSIPADAVRIAIEPYRLNNDRLLEILISAIKEQMQVNERDV